MLRIFYICEPWPGADPTGINDAGTKGFRPSDPSHSGGNGWTGCSYKAKEERPGERGKRLSLGRDQTTNPPSFTHSFLQKEAIQRNAIEG